MPGYTDNNANVRREFFAGEIGGAAATSYAKFRSFMKFRLRRVHCAVSVLGGTTHKFDVYHGTNSIGSLGVGAAPVDTKMSTSLINEVVDSLEEVSVKSGPDAVGKGFVILEYETLWDAPQAPR